MPASVRDILLMIRTKEDASRSMNTIAGSMRRAQAAAEAASARARAAALRAQAVQARTAGATVAQVRALQQAAKAQDAYAHKIENTNRKAADLGHAVDRTSHILQTGGLVAIAAGAATMYGLKQAIDVAAAWDRQVRLTYTQVDKRFKPSLQELSDIGLRVAKDIAVPFESIQTALFDVFSSTEANMPQAEQLLRSFAKAAVAGQTDIQTASRATIGLMNSYKIPFEDVNKVLDIQFQLVQEGVGTYEEWSQRIGLVTPSAVRAGQSIETMAAALSTATRQGMSAARSGTAVARAFDAMSNPKTEAALAKIGVKTRDAQGNFRPLVKVLGDWRAQLEKMPKEDRIKAILDVLKGAGSTIEARRFLQNILLTKGGLELFQDQIKEFATDKGAFQNAYNEMAGSVAAQTEKLRNSWQTLKLAIGQALLPAFQQLVGWVQKILDWFNKLPEGTKKTIAQFLLWGSILTMIGGVIAIAVGAIVGLAAAVVTAGAALAPFLGIMAGIGAILTAVVGGLVAFGTAMVVAYQNSQNFRDLLSTVKSAIQGVWDVIVGFAKGVWDNFNTYIMPPLRHLGQVINDEVLPKVQAFIAWWQANMVPQLQAAGHVINENLKPAFKAAGDLIENTLIPAIKDASAWWDKHGAKVLMVAKFLGQMVVAGLAVTSFIVGRLIPAVIGMISWFVKVGSAIRNGVAAAFRFLLAPIQAIIAIIQKLISWFRNIGKGAQAGATMARNAISGLKNSIMGIFAGAAGWLISAGRNIVAGLANGIRGGAGAVAAAARGVAANAIAAAKATLAIKSPSRVFKDIGMDVIRGFTEGVKNATTLKQLQTAMYRVSRDVIRSINAADIKKSAKDKMRNRWNKKLSSTTSRLTKLENQRIATQKRLTAAQKSVNDQIKARDDLAVKIRDSLTQQADITSLDTQQQQSPAWMIRGLTERLQGLKNFQAQLRSLAKRGLDKETIAQLAQQGPEVAGALVSKLVSAGNGDLKKISQLQAEIRKVAGQTGTNVAGDLYNAGIKAGQGLVKGLQSQIANITKQMTAIATALVKQIKKELGIKSPSRVFMDIGVNTAQGYINGYIAKMNADMQQMAAASMFAPQSPALPTGRATAPVGTGVTRNYHQTINVTTQEIDPRRHAAELGWLLESRVS